MDPHIHSLASSVTIALYGPKRQAHDRLLALIHGARGDSICLIKAPGSAELPGYQTITEPRFTSLYNTEPDVFAEGVILSRSGSAAIIRPADCSTLIGVTIDKETKQKRMVVTHAGRAAMTPTNTPGEPIKNIVTIAHEALVEGFEQPEVHIYIVGSICGNCFEHNGPNDEPIVGPFDQFGSHAFVDRSRGALDLVSIIKSQLIDLGVSEANIKHDGICTYETPYLASYRRDRSEARNAVVAVLY